MNNFSLQSAEDQYIALAEHVLKYGNDVPNDRTGTGMIESFGHMLKFDLSHGFPLLTSKRMYLRLPATEMIWYLRGEGNTDYLKKNNVTFWDEWARPDGSLGPVYGVQMRQWIGEGGKMYDQVKQTLHSLKEHPTSRRHVISLWSVHELNLMALPPCPTLLQFNVCGDRLNLHVYQRSADIFLGLPFDIVVFSLLNMVFAHEVGLKPGVISYSLGSAHIYNNHVEQITEQIQRHKEDPKPVPRIKIYYRDKLFDSDLRFYSKPTYKANDFQIEDYESHGPLYGDVSV